jgi:hypothetical protein
VCGGRRGFRVTGSGLGGAAMQKKGISWFCVLSGDRDGRGRN